MKAFIFLFIAIIILVWYIVTLNLSSYSPSTTPAQGCIERIIRNENDDFWFYVRFEVDGKSYLGKTEAYTKIPDDLEPGRTVNIGYYFNDTGNAVCRINEPDFTSAILPQGARSTPVSLYISIGFFLLFLILLFKRI